MSIIVGAVSTLAAVGVGTAIGLAAGYLGGWVDRVLSWFIDTTLSLPFLLFATSLVALAGPGLMITVVVIILFSWCPIARVVRGQVLGMREREFIEGASAAAARPWIEAGVRLVTVSSSTALFTTAAAALIAELRG